MVFTRCAEIRQYSSGRLIRLFKRPHLNDTIGDCAGSFRHDLDDFIEVERFKYRETGSLNKRLVQFRAAVHKL